MIRVYLAGPLGDDAGEHHLVSALAAARGLWGRGFAPLTPHVWQLHQGRHTLAYEARMEHAEQLLAQCSVVLRLLPNAKSQCAAREERTAEAYDLPVLTSVAALESWAPPELRKGRRIASGYGLGPLAAEERFIAHSEGCAIKLASRYLAGASVAELAREECVSAGAIWMRLLAAGAVGRFRRRAPRREAVVAAVRAGAPAAKVAKRLGLRISTVRSYLRLARLYERMDRARADDKEGAAA